ncbi:MAG: DUF2125 domain-containing protein [Pseudomonadota bacterium]
MTRTRTLMMTSALALVSALPAYADLTAEQVLADQLRQMELYGMSAEVTGQSRLGDTLTVDGIVASAETPDAKIMMEIGGANFRELGDGTVEVTYPDIIPMSIKGTTIDEEPFEMAVSMSQTNTRMVVSGIPEEITYNFTSEAFSIDGMEFIAPEEAAELDMDIAVQIAGLSGIGRFVGGGTVRDYTADINVDSMSATISGAPEDDAGNFSLVMEIADVVADYEGSVAPQNLMASFAQSIEAGNETNGTASHGPLTYTISGDGPDGTFDIAAAIASGAFEFAMGRTGLDYTTTANAMTVSVGGDFMPLPPLTFKMAESGMRFAMPVVPSEEEQDFGLRLSFGGLEVDPTLWGMIDPAGQIPRDPATLTVDLDGAVVMLEDVFDPAFAEEMTGVPGQINALNINEILLTIAGAELTGDGAFTFNNEGFMPMPSGVVNLMLTGGNGLLDTLVNMGLVPEEQAMGARMMMGLFAQPGDGDDTLVSTIEVQEDGSVLANGQRIR